MNSNVCLNASLDEISMILIFNMLDSSNQEIKYACTCQSFAEGAGIDYRKLSVEDWKKFCLSIKGKRINFILKETSDE